LLHMLAAVSVVAVPNGERPRLQPTDAGENSQRNATTDSPYSWCKPGPVVLIKGPRMGSTFLLQAMNDTGVPCDAVLEVDHYGMQAWQRKHNRSADAMPFAAGPNNKQETAQWCQETFAIAKQALSCSPHGGVVSFSEMIYECRGEGLSRMLSELPTKPRIVSLSRKNIVAQALAIYLQFMLTDGPIPKGETLLRMTEDYRDKMARADEMAKHVAELIDAPYIKNTFEELMDASVDGHLGVPELTEKFLCLPHFKPASEGVGSGKQTHSRSSDIVTQLEEVRRYFAEHASPRFQDQLREIIETPPGRVWTQLEFVVRHEENEQHEEKEDDEHTPLGLTGLAWLDGHK